MLRADPKDRVRTSRGKPGKSKGAGRRRKAGTGGKSRKAARRGLLRPLLTWSLVAAIWVSVIGAGIVAWFAYDLPDVSRIAELTRRPSVTLLAADGSQVAAFGDLYGETVRLRDLPPHVPHAVLAVEDRRFYEHVGLDIWGLMRAVVVNLRAGRIVQGGSTITQQLAKIMFLTPERSLKRKVQEALLAFWLERRFSKDQILTLYLNRVYLGAGTYGLDAAAKRYFGKPATQLSIYEAAMLAGLLKAPSRYNPANDADLADARTRLVLRAMVEAGFIRAETAQQAQQSGAQAPAPSRRAARHYADWVMSLIPDFVGQVDRDLVVATTLDPRLQRIAEEETRAMVAADGMARAASQAAFVALSPEGAVRAMVGGTDYGESQFNRAAQALRQPGSAFKTFVYLAALEQGFKADDRFVDAPVNVAGWQPKNYGDRYFGEVTLREAFARSLNSVAVQITQRVGPQAVAEVAQRLGISTSLEAAPSLALGTSEVTLLELTGAYTAFANKGWGVWPYAIVEIREANGRILYQRSGGGPGRVVSPEHVNSMVDVMRAGVAWGTGKAARPDRPAGGKTGTSQEFRDAWFIGFTAELVAGVWFGNDDGQAMDGVTGGSLPARLWGRVVGRALEGEPPRPLPAAAPVVAADEPWPAEQPAAQEDEEIGLIARILRNLSGSSEDDGTPRRNGPRPPGDGGPLR